MRRQHDVGQRAERQVVRGRFLLVNVQRRAADLAALQRLEQRGLIDQAAARAVDDAHALLALGQRRRVENLVRLGRQRHVHGDEIGARQEVGQIVRQLHLQAARAALHEIGIVGDDVHPERNRAPRDFAADAAHADDAQRLAVQLGSLERFAVPLARHHGGVRLRNLARQREQQREGVLRGGDRVSARRVHDHDAALGRRGHIDVVHAHARAADDLQPLRRGERLGRHLGLAADDERVEVGDVRDQFVFLQTAAGRDFKLGIFRENGDAFWRDPIGGEDAERIHPRTLQEAARKVKTCVRDEIVETGVRSHVGPRKSR